MEEKRKEEETRRVSPRLQGGEGKISQEAEEAKIKKEEEIKEQEKKDHVGIIKELGLKHCRRKSWAAYGMLYFDGYAFANGTADYIFEDEIDEHGMKKVLSFINRTAEPSSRP